MLLRLVKAGVLTVNQAKRATSELTASLHQQIPGYELLEKLGPGSMGTVYKAQRGLSMNRLVAVKMLHPRPHRQNRVAPTAHARRHTWQPS